jgi:uncharacterized protein (DUF3084 family)
MEERTRQKLETRVARLEQQIKAFKELHASELGLILEELASLRGDLAAMAAPPATEAAPAGTAADPAAGSPKRAAWLAEQQRKEEERRAPLSRRELLRGREPAEDER